MRAFEEKQELTGSWDENRDTTIRIFETLSWICEVTEEDTLD